MDTHAQPGSKPMPQGQRHGQFISNVGGFRRHNPLTDVEISVEYTKCRILLIIMFTEQKNTEPDSEDTKAFFGLFKAKTVHVEDKRTGAVAEVQGRSELKEWAELTDFQKEYARNKLSKYMDESNLREISERIAKAVEDAMYAIMDTTTELARVRIAMEKAREIADARNDTTNKTDSEQRAREISELREGLKKALLHIESLENAGEDGSVVHNTAHNAAHDTELKKLRQRGGILQGIVLKPRILEVVTRTVLTERAMELREANPDITATEIAIVLTFEFPKNCGIRGISPKFVGRVLSKAIEEKTGRKPEGQHWNPSPKTRKYIEEIIALKTEKPEITLDELSTRLGITARHVGEICSTHIYPQHPELRVRGPDHKHYATVNPKVK